MTSSTPVEVVVFDVNETLSDMSAMGQRFAELGVDAGLAKIWFAGLLRDGFALTLAGANERFATLAREGLYGLLEGASLDRDLDTSVEYVLDGFSALEVHADVPDGVRTLAGAGLRLVTLSNGATAVADALLQRAGLRDRFETLLSVEDAGVWKPARAAYEYAAHQCKVGLDAMLLVAVHPWDVDGAARAGMRTAWVDRSAGRYPAYCRTPDRTATGIADLAAQLT